MTNREFYTAVINGSISADVVDFAKSAIEKMDVANARRKTSGKALEHMAENARLEEAILKALNDGAMLTTEIAKAVGVSNSKASGVLVRMETCSKVFSESVSVKGKGKQKMWDIVEE